MGEPAWKSLPSWYLVATEDEAIPPDAERQFARRMGATTVEVPSSHVPMVSHPKEVVELIESALEACPARWLTTGARWCRSGLRTCGSVRPSAATEQAE